MPASDPSPRPENPDRTPAVPGAEPGLEPNEERGFRMRALVARARAQAAYRELEARRSTSDTVEAGFRWIRRDVQIAGGVLGGGLAYRFFFWVLSISLLVSGGLGFASRHSVNVQSAAGEAGLTEGVAESVASAAEQWEGGRWWLLLLGVWLTVWFSWGLLRALRLVHGAAWRVEPRPIRRPLLALGAVVAAPFALVVVLGLAGWVRVNVGLLSGVAATLAAGVAFGVVWLRISMRLPSADVPWTAFVPGAVLFGVGVDVLHVFTVYFLEDKLASAEAHYGAMGLAATMLFYLWMIGRGVVWAAELNAVVWEVRHPSPEEPADRGPGTEAIETPA